MKNITVSVVGLGYVGLPVAVAFGKRQRTIGFDINKTRIEELKKGHDRTNEVADADLKAADILYTSDIAGLKKANTHSSRPGATDKANVSWGTRPMRLKTVGKARPSSHTFTKIRPLDTVAAVYGLVLTGGVHKAPSIKVAEAAKVIENSQRDINIAFINELAMIFDRLGIDTQAVLEAAGTKWNFLKFKPGLVGGHCIGVDPYYLTHKAESVGYIPQVILAGRRINDSMGKFIAQRTVKEMIKAGHNIHGSTVTVLGLTFKENCPDLRNSKVIDIIRELQDYGIKVQVTDPGADPAEAMHEYGVTLTPFNKLKKANAVVLAVAHKEYASLQPKGLLKIMGSKPVLADVKALYAQTALEKAGLSVWRL